MPARIRQAAEHIMLQKRKENGMTEYKKVTYKHLKKGQQIHGMEERNLPFQLSRLY